jgi:UDP-N-acetylmuramoyl-L-alanyl-D-glutamate--2,6-diaminopimelate ligase
VTTLGDLLAGAGLPPPAPGGAAVEVTGVAYDSRRVTPGALFVAIPGEHTDGHRHARAAVDAGAVAVVAQRPPDPPLDGATPLVLVGDTQVALAALAAAMWGHPSRLLTVAGVTGTDGKTTTTTMLHAAWRGAALPAAALTTVDFRTRDRIVPNTTRQTTLESADVQERLRSLVDDGITHVALETSSHALALHRVDELRFRVAVFTRITSEHLDFHGTREAYRDAKASLLSRAAEHPDGVAVLDRDDDFAYAHLRAMHIAHRLAYSASGRSDADLRAEDVLVDAGGVHFTARTPWGDAQVDLQVAGSFNVSNALAALAAACATGASLDGAVHGLMALDRVSGRMERIDVGQPFSVVIDYAHTAEALRTVLRELRPATRGQLWAVFGSAGRRDVEKRPEMGRVAAELADRIVVTDEDPREEDRMAILDQIAMGARESGRHRYGDTLVVVPERSEAIRYALGKAAPGDTVLLAGKGHESTLIGAGGPLPWDERGVAEAALHERLARDGRIS